MNARMLMVALGAATCLLAQSPQKAPKAKPSKAEAAVKSASPTDPAVIVAKPTEKSQAYYYYSVGHLYADLAAQAGFRGENVDKAIDNLKQALKIDPEAELVSEELADIYLQSGRITEAVSESEAAIKANPQDINSRRILGRMYTRMLSDQRTGRIDRSMLRKSLEQYSKITEMAPNDSDAWLMLGRLYKFDNNNIESEAAFNKALALEPESEEALTGLAMIYADKGDTKRAGEALEKVNSKNPSMRSLMALAQTYEQIKDFDNASKAYLKAFESSGGNPEILRALAQNQLMARKYDDALDSFEKLAEVDPEDGNAWFRISQIYRLKRELPKARTAQDKASKLDPNSFDVMFNEMDLLSAEGKYPEAVAQIEKMISVAAVARGGSDGPNKNFRAELLERLGYLRSENNDHAKAAEAFKEAAQLDPNNAPRFMVGMIESMRSAKNFTGALREAEELKRIYPQNPSVQRAYAEVLADMGRYPDAAAQLNEVLKNQPEDRAVMLQLAQTYDKAKDFVNQDKILAQVEKLSDGQDEQIEVHFLRGASYEKRKQFDDSEAQFKKVLALDPNNAGALNYLGYMLADRNVRLAEAQQMISRALELSPNNGAYLDSLGWVYYRQQKYEEAEQVLLQAMQRYPSDPTIYDHLADVYYARGRTKEAIQQWENALKEWNKASVAERDGDLIAKVEKKLEQARVKLSQDARPKKDRN